MVSLTLVLSCGDDSSDEENNSSTAGTTSLSSDQFDRADCAARCDDLGTECNRTEEETVACRTACVEHETACVQCMMSATCDNVSTCIESCYN